jgi:hypothetical protein
VHGDIAARNVLLGPDFEPQVHIVPPPASYTLLCHTASYRYLTLVWRARAARRRHCYTDPF